MRVTFYNNRYYDEDEVIDRCEKELGLEVVRCKEDPTLETLELARGSKCIDIITTKMPRELLQKCKEIGVEYVVTRCIGYDHIDIQAARELGIHVANAPYGPHGVADYTVMLMIMSIRNMKRIIERTNLQDYTLKGLIGCEMHQMCVGVIGTGRIGKTVLKNLTGFGCQLLAYDLYEDAEVKDIAEYVSLEELIKRSDIISLHMPLTEQNFHLIGKETIAKMKDGVVIINTARGGLIDTQALIEGIECGKIGAAALDVVENEFGLYYNDRKSDVLDNRELAILRGFPNVTVSHHMAFYTKQEVETVVHDSLLGCKLYMEGKDNPWEITK